MKKTNPLFYYLLASILIMSCTPKQAFFQGTKIQLDTTQFNAIYASSKEEKLQHRRFKHADIAVLLQEHAQHQRLVVEKVGQSVEQRPIYKVGYGQGPKQVMLWSQMHGDEPTATMALFDLFNFLSAQDDGYDSVRHILKEQLTLHMVPMLNPDGAERYMRRNAQHIDLNRDARSGQTVEGALLRQLAQQIKPQYGFNLHDQNIYYNVPNTKNPVTISLLAPAYNVEREVNDVRRGAMQLIVGMNELLQQYIPEAVAKYDDTYTPRGFGDNFQSWGASTVLIESGGLKGDVEKQEIRKFNFIIILNALLQIAQDQYQEYPASGYEDIPFNASQLHDVVLRGVDLGNDSAELLTDIALRRSEVTVGGDYFVRGRVEDIGDLQESFGYDEVAAQNLFVVAGKTYATAFDSVASVSMEQAWHLLKQGFIAVRVNKQGEQRLHNLPLIVFTQQHYRASAELTTSGLANFFLADDQGLRYAVVNGYLIDLRTAIPHNTEFKNRVQ